MEDCIFCKIIAGEVGSKKVYEDENVYAFLDNHPVTPYHTLVIPKKHYRDIFDIPEGELQNVTRAIKHLTTLYAERLGIHNIQIVNNSGAEAQQDVFHIHFHIVPRQANDGQNITWTSHPEMQPEFDAMLSILI